MKKIAFCEQNFAQGTQYVIDYLQNNYAQDFDIKIARCLGECGECFSQCIADYHGTLLTADTPQLLLNLILSKHRKS